MRRLKVHSVLAALVLGLGLVLLSGKVFADSEPGALPILLVLVGAGWYLATRVRIRAQRK